MLFASFYLLFGLTAPHGVTMETSVLRAALMPRTVVFEACPRPVAHLANPGRNSRQSAHIVLE
jgi:hypothetical protein